MWLCGEWVRVLWLKDLLSFPNLAELYPFENDDEAGWSVLNLLPGAWTSLLSFPCLPPIILSSGPWGRNSRLSGMLLLRWQGSAAPLSSFIEILAVLNVNCPVAFVHSSSPGPGWDISFAVSSTWLAEQPQRRYLLVWGGERQNGLNHFAACSPLHAFLMNSSNLPSLQPYSFNVFLLKWEWICAECSCTALCLSCCCSYGDSNVKFLTDIQGNKPGLSDCGRVIRKCCPRLRSQGWKSGLRFCSHSATNFGQHAYFLHSSVYLSVNGVLCFTGLRGLIR